MRKSILMFLVAVICYNPLLNLGAQTGGNMQSSEASPPEESDGKQAAGEGCDWNQKNFSYFGDLHDNWSVGPVATYSLVRYNLADKEASFNAKSAGGGFSFRLYTNGELRRHGKTSIREVPAGCRAQTEDLLPSNKVGATVSFQPTFYLSQAENEGELETQLAFNVGLLNDLVTVGAGWNLSGEDAGEWFVIIGPSFGFSF